MVILNVDDDAEDRAIFADAMKEISPSITCLTANNGIDAQSLWRSDPSFPQLDFIFLDINMPKMNGMELLEVIREDTRFNHVPVYMLSTTCNEAEISRINSLGAIYIEKQGKFTDIVAGLSSIIYPKPELIELEGKQ